MLISFSTLVLASQLAGRGIWQKTVHLRLAILMATQPDSAMHVSISR